MEYELWDGEECGEDYGDLIRVPCRYRYSIDVSKRQRTNEYAQDEEWRKLGEMSWGKEVIQRLAGG